MVKHLFFTCLMWAISVANGTAQAVTYWQDIKPIIDEHCISCHHNDGIGPMSLSTYEEVLNYATMVGYVTKHNIMPPWKADFSYSRLKNENSLTSTEIETIAQWINDGMSEGFVTNTAVTEVDPVIERRKWVEFEMQESFVHEGEYLAGWQVFVIPNHLNQDLYIDAVEFVPGNESIVQSVFISLDTTFKASKLEKTDRKPGYYNLGGVGFLPSDFIWYHWNPESGTRYLKGGEVKKIDQNSSILMHVQYAPSSDNQEDRSKLRVRLNDENQLNSTLVKSGILAGPNDLLKGKFIRPHDVISLRHRFMIEKPIDLYSVTPFGQYICKSWTIYAIKNGGEIKIPILKIDDWDVMWRRTYQLGKPLPLKPGDEILISAEYDNTVNNDQLPQRVPRNVYPGEGKRGEMFMVTYEYVEPNENIKP